MDTRLARSVFGEHSFYRETRGMRLVGYHVAKRSSDLRVCVCIRVKRRFQQFFSHITTMSGCDRELNAHFYSAASLKYHVPDT